jgi:hypothetical protein
MMKGNEFSRQSSTYQTRKLVREIRKIKTPEQINIVFKEIEDAFKTHRITYEEYGDLLSKLNDRVSKIGEKKRVLKLGPLGEFGGEKKGAI